MLLFFDLNRGIPRKIFLTNGKEGERPFVDRILQPGETEVTDRGYQRHHNFDQLQAAGKHFVSRIKANTIKTCLESSPVATGSIVFYDAKVLLGKEGVNRRKLLCVWSAILCSIRLSSRKSLKHPAKR